MERGMDLNDSDGNGCGHLGVAVRGEDMHLTVSTYSDRTSTQVVAGLSVEEIDEYIGLLKDARTALRPDPDRWTAQDVAEFLGPHGRVSG
jgi:hypothetical protein